MTQTTLSSPTPSHRMSPRRWALSILGFIVLLAFFYVMMNLYTPYTADAYVQRYVVQMAPLVSGRVTQVYVSDNAKVKAGDPLFDLDSRAFEYELRSAEAKLEMAKQQVAELNRDVVIADAALNDAKELQTTAQTLFDEMKRLRDSNAASYIEYVTALDRLETRKSTVRENQAALEKTKLALAAIVENEHALIRQAEAEVKAAKWRLDQAHVVSPGDGYVTNLQLQPGSSIAANVPAITFVDSSKWWIIANFDENSVGRIKPGNEAEFSLRSQPGGIFKAKVDCIGWGVERGQGQPSGKLPSPDRSQMWIRPPQRLPVKLQIDMNNADNIQAPPVGASVAVTVYTAQSNPLNLLAALWQRISAKLDYLY